jgi:mono/diheme cytochrome c family protein
MSRKPLIAVLSLLPVLLGIVVTASAADAQAGKAKFQQACSQCHDASDWKGKSEAQVAVMIKDRTSGKAKHPKRFDLTNDEIANIAAWASGTG